MQPTGLINLNGNTSKRNTMPLTSITSKATMYNSKKDATKGSTAKKSTAKGKRVLKNAPKRGSAKKRSPEFLKGIEELKKRAASLKAKSK